MDEFDFLFVARKSIRGIFALISRTFIIQFLSILAFFIISAQLDPSIFGIYIIAQSIIVFFNYFQDVGLAASLIQKKEEPTLSEYRSVFTTQQAIVLLFVIPSLVFAEPITAFYNLDRDGMYLFMALVISFLLTSLRTIPSVMLERKLDFGKLVIPQIGENLVFNISLIVLVLLNFQIASFTIAVLLRSITGVILTYIIMPWSIGLSFSVKDMKQLFSFGIPFQTNNILALVKDDLLIVYIGKILAFSQVGYVGFAQKLAFYPLRLVMDNVIRITFPSYSRLQHDQTAMKIAIEKSLFLVSFFIFPTAFGIMLLSGLFLELIPRYQKWEPAVLSILFFAGNTIFSSISTPLTNFLNAIGKVKITLLFMLFWTAATWGFTLLFIDMFGYNGVAMASFAVSISSLGVIIVTRRYVAFSFIKSVFRQFIAASVMAVFLYVTRSYISSVLSLSVLIFFGGVVYMCMMMLLAKTELLKISRFVYHSVRNTS